MQSETHRGTDRTQRKNTKTTTGGRAYSVTIGKMKVGDADF